MQIKKLAKSKTVGAATVAPLLIALARQLGIELSPEVAAFLVSLLMVAMRYVTRRPLSEL